MIDDGIASELGAEYALRVEDQMKVKHNAYGMKPQASGLTHRLQLHSPIWIKEIHLFRSPHQRTLTDRFGVYPSGNGVDDIIIRSLRGRALPYVGVIPPRVGSLLSPEHTCLAMLWVTTPCSIIAALTFFLFPNFALI